MVKKEKICNKKKIIVVLAVLLVLTFGVIIKSLFFTGEVIANTQEVEIVPLTQEEIQLIGRTILSSEFVEDVPSKYPIALRFFSFSQSGEKIWRSGFLIGENQLLTSGDAGVYLSLNSKYISEFAQSNICDVIRVANVNGDLGFDSPYNKASLLLKYSGMVKHRDCFGF
ncbi:hypothetical protein HN903_00605 [archaeon]|jgi:hypothetical protein|nr:hypothetical protein [archaeon]MBT7128234.1 hypothetical protein [archaeon]